MPSLEEKLQLAACMASSVAALHAQGLCHGGLSARCILAALGGTTQQPRIRVADAGVVPTLRRVGIVRHHEHLLLGVSYARYLAPEGWCADSFDATQAADVWSLSQVVAECLGLGAPHADCTTMQRLSSKVLSLRSGSGIPEQRWQNSVAKPLWQELEQR